VAEDLFRLPDVGLDDSGGFGVVEQDPGVGEHHRVIVDVDDLHVRRVPLGDLVDVALGGQTRAEVDELPDAHLLDEIPHDAAEERPIGPASVWSVRGYLERLLGDHTIHGEIVLAAEEDVVDPRHTRLSRVYALRHRPFARHPGPYPKPSIVGGHDP
jgi:hypothetical protein